VQDFFGSVDYDFSACFPYVLDFFEADFGAAWSDAVDAFDACGDECC
jgi:hypothetical protein